MPSLKSLTLFVILSAVTILTTLDVYTILWRQPTNTAVYINLEQLVTLEDLNQKQPVASPKRSDYPTAKTLHPRVRTLCKYQMYEDLKGRNNNSYADSKSTEIDTYINNECEAHETCKPKTEGKVFLDFRRISLAENDDVDAIQNLHMGGWYVPEVPCKTKSVAIIVPYRDREIQLGIFLRHYHDILQKQQLHYRIFVIDQADESEFNRGKLMNVGYSEALKYFPYDCFVFHDVDLILEDDRVFYNCPSSPMHLSVALDKFKYRLLYDELFGGVEMFTKSHFELVNGFSNSFWGWGAEDDNLYRRLKWRGLTLWRPPTHLAKYSTLPHYDNEIKASSTRFDIRKESYKHFATDGLTKLLYQVISSDAKLSHTLVKVNLQKETDTLFGVTGH